MAAKQLEIHPSALEELKAAVAWSFERSETSATKFVDEVDRAIGLVAESPSRWPAGEHATRKLVQSKTGYLTGVVSVFSRLSKVS